MSERPHGFGPKAYKDKEKLAKLYVEDRRSAREVSEFFDITRPTISYWVDKHDLTGYKYPELADRENLVKMYHGERMKMQEIADEVGCGKSAVIWWIHEHDIETREYSDYTGAENWAWKGGESIYIRLRQHYNGGWDKRCEMVRERQDRECYKCGTHEENLRRRLDVHHIVPIKSGGVNHLDNLMGVCSSCHDTIERYTQDLLGTPLMDAMDLESQ